MIDETIKTAVAAWAAKDLPARLDVGTTAKLLGFAEHDIQILMGVGKLTPLGDPAPNAPKWLRKFRNTGDISASDGWKLRAIRCLNFYQTGIRRPHNTE